MEKQQAKAGHGAHQIPRRMCGGRRHTRARTAPLSEPGAQARGHTCTHAAARLSTRLDSHTHTGATHKRQEWRRAMTRHHSAPADTTWDSSRQGSQGTKCDSESKSDSKYIAVKIRFLSYHLAYHHTNTTQFKSDFPAMPVSYRQMFICSYATAAAYRVYYTL